jgi:hypothetical protein
VDGLTEVAWSGSPGFDRIPAKGSRYLSEFRAILAEEHFAEVLERRFVAWRLHLVPP